MNRPNLLLITTDQHRADALGCAGNRFIRTPHFDWLANTGIRFSRCYSDAPVCAAARSTLITGRHFYNLPKGIGNFGQPSAPDATQTLPARLSQNGYQTRLVGKAHYVPERCNYGWEHMEILEDYYREMARHPERGVPMDHGLGQNEMYPGIATVDESHTLTHWTVRRAIEFLETRDETRPFCLHVSFSKPHPPWDPPLNYWQLYQNAEVPQPRYGDWSQKENVAPGWMTPTWSLNGVDEFSPELLRDCRRAYYALITQIDYNLGLLFSRLREMNLFENTLLVFTADHGEMLGDHHMGAKAVMFEGSMHVPMIVRPPASWQGERGATCDEIVCLADVVETFANAAQLPPNAVPDGDGIDLLQAAKGEASRERLFGFYGGFHCVVEGDYKYTFCERGAAELLFDLKNDPYEERDLIRGGDKENHARLRGALIEHLAALNHPSVQNGELVSTGTPPTRRAARANPWPGFHHRTQPPFEVLH
jgi:arylsulfatase